MTDVSPVTCPCGHVDAAHELCVCSGEVDPEFGEGGVWWSVEGMEMKAEEVERAENNGALFSYCGICMDGCEVLATDARRSGQ